MKENAFRASLRRKLAALRQAGAPIHIFAITDSYFSGRPDTFGVISGVPVAIEYKNEDGQASPLQRKFLADTVRAGGLAGVVRPATTKGYALRWEPFEGVAFGPGVEYLRPEDWLEALVAEGRALSRGPVPPIRR